jgi:lysine-N-methylase
MLCQTCREFPRLRHDYGDFVELGLELSCPEAARLMFTEESQWVETEIPGGEAPEYDPADMEMLLRTREKMLEILADPRYSVEETLALALLYGYRAQDGLDGEEEVEFDPEEELAFGRSVAKRSDVVALTEYYLSLEILTEEWARRLRSARKEPQWDERLRILARCSVERYWLQAISDVDLVGRVKMMVASCLLVAHLDGDFVRTVQLYSKEIDNNGGNVDAILDGAYSHPALTDETLLGWLL